MSENDIRVEEIERSTVLDGFMVLRVQFTLNTSNYIISIVTKAKLSHMTKISKIYHESHGWKNDFLD